MERFFIEEIWNYIISQLDKVPDDIFAPEHVQKARLKCEKLMRSRFEPESTVCQPGALPRSHIQLFHNQSLAVNTPLPILCSIFYALYRALK